MKDKIAKLIDLKSIVTLMVLTVFCYLAIIGTMSAEDFKLVVVMIVTFYFGRKLNS